MFRSISSKVFANGSLFSQKCILSTNPFLIRNFSITQTKWDISIISKTADDDQLKSVTFTSQSDVLEPHHYNIEPLELTNVNTSLTPIREVWVENMSTPHSIKLGIIQLNPQIFSVFPRPDMIQENHKWQTLYKHVDYQCMPTRSELRGSNKKPWPQKGTGRARHSSRRAPQWVHGGWANGPRGPRTYFYMLPWQKRVAGLIATLSCKFSQNDIHVVDTFETFPLDGTSDHLEELCETRGWGPSVLFVDRVDLELSPKCTNAEHFYNASTKLNPINIIPMYGLNVFSILKHETLVFTVDALKDIERKLVFQLNRVDLKNVIFKYKPRGFIKRY